MGRKKKIKEKDIMHKRSQENIEDITKEGGGGGRGNANT